ncbi:MAG TPA: hypothetical protein VNT54_00320 [Solirubrobacteraceae bacterium]|nr:hypothetical protein [Solirubrobacteraceae bacterium]
MDLARHAAVVWRFRTVAAAGLSLAIVLAVLASYSVSFSGGLHFTPRGTEVWTAVSSIHVTQPGFPEGRVTLPTRETDQARAADGRAAVPTNATPNEQVEFADPGRLANLADLYAKFLMTAEVLGRVQGRPKTSQIQASPFLSSTGSQALPIIELRADSDSRRNAERLNLAIYEALRTILAERQTANEIPVGKRVEVKLLDPPDVVLASGRSRTMAVIALVLCLLGTLAVVHLLEALRGPRRSPSDRDDDELAAIAPWMSTPPPSHDEARTKRLAPPPERAGVPERHAAAGRRSPP